MYYRCLGITNGSDEYDIYSPEQMLHWDKLIDQTIKGTPLLDSPNRLVDVQSIMK